MAQNERTPNKECFHPRGSSVILVAVVGIKYLEVDSDLFTVSFCAVSECTRAFGDNLLEFNVGHFLQYSTVT